MALSAAQKTQVFEILGIPEAGGGVAYNELVGAYTSLGSATNLARAVEHLSAVLTGMTASQEARVVALLARHTAVTATSPLQVTAAAGGARGVLVDHPAEREAIRSALGNVLGFAVPLGGFVAEAARKARGAGEVGR